MASPTLIDHRMVSGDTATPMIGQVVDSSGVPRDINGWRLRYVAFYSDEEDAEILLDKSTSQGGITITDADTGTYRVEFDADDTDAFGGRTFPHEVESFDIAGKLETVGFGTLQIIRDLAT